MSLYDLAAALGFALQGLGLALFGSGLRREPLHLFRGSEFPTNHFKASSRLLKIGSSRREKVFMLS